jgi:hypothetical protein
VGLVLGYHLALAGADVSFLVRPGRKTVFQAPQKLYSYDDSALKTFDGYQTFEETSELVGQSFRFVVVTLDGYTSRTPQGATTLRKLGDAVRGCGATFIMSGGFGIGLREHYAELLAIPSERLLSGFSTILSHPTRAELPVHAPTNAALLAQARRWGVRSPSSTRSPR